MTENGASDHVDTVADYLQEWKLATTKSQWIAILSRARRAVGRRELSMQDYYKLFDEIERWEEEQKRNYRDDLNDA